MQTRTVFDVTETREKHNYRVDEIKFPRATWHNDSDAAARAAAAAATVFVGLLHRNSTSPHLIVDHGVGHPLPRTHDRHSTFACNVDIKCARCSAVAGSRCYLKRMPQSRCSLILGLSANRVHFFRRFYFKAHTRLNVSILNGPLFGYWSVRWSICR